MKLDYRPEIDGLRAIAVVAVILYHADITIFGHNLFKGGFLGVDIFFVISGYLITSLILKELEATGNFSFLHFYERRARRILPALFVVMSASLPIAWIYLLPTSFIHFSNSILYSLGFSSNIYFHYSGLQYGAEDGLLKPFLHTWSLSVEEQFYVLFPLGMVFIYKYFKRYLIPIFLIGISISLGLADWGSEIYPSATFYFLHSRMWELLAGSLLAYLEIQRGNRFSNPILNRTLPILGLFLIGHSIVFFNDKMAHPSFFTLSPVLGTCLLIWYANEKELITKILSSNLFVEIGLISYSLYLWHYPVFAFGRIQGHAFKIQWILITVVLSVFTYFLVETPFRKYLSSKVTGRSLILVLLSLVLLNIEVIANKGFKIPSRIPNLLINLDNLVDSKYELKDKNNISCHGNIEGCHFLKPYGKNIFMIGDSHFATLQYDLQKRLDKTDYSFHVYTAGGCFFIPDFFRYSYGNPNGVNPDDIDSRCTTKFQDNFLEAVSQNKNSTVIIGGRLPYYLSRKMFDNKEGGKEGKELHPKFDSNLDISLSEHFKRSVETLTENNFVILVYPIPEAGWNVPNKIRNLLSQRPKTLFFNPSTFFSERLITTSYDVYLERSKQVFELYDSIQNEKVYRVYPDKVFCNVHQKNRCSNHDMNDSFYLDDDHPSAKGAEMINALIMNEIKNSEANTKK